MKVNMDQLKSMLDILVDKAKNAGIDEIEIDRDNYWLVAAEDRENFQTDAPEICVGSLDDDMQSLQRVLDGTNIPTVPDFERLANLLIAVGEEIYRSPKVY